MSFLYRHKRIMWSFLILGKIVGDDYSVPVNPFVTVTRGFNNSRETSYKPGLNNLKTHVHMKLNRHSTDSYIVCI